MIPFAWFLVVVLVLALLVAAGQWALQNLQVRELLHERDAAERGERAARRDLDVERYGRQHAELMLAANRDLLAALSLELLAAQEALDAASAREPFEPPAVLRPRVDITFGAGDGSSRVLPVKPRGGRR